MWSHSADKVQSSTGCGDKDRLILDTGVIDCVCNDANRFMRPFRVVINTGANHVSVAKRGSIAAKILRLTGASTKAISKV
jgi:hypothetical protein